MKRLSSMTKMFLKVFLSFFLPKHIKRMIFLVIIHTRLSNAHLIRNSTLDRLNAKLGVAQSPDVLKFVDSFGSKIPLDEAKLKAFISQNQDTWNVCVPDDELKDRVAPLIESSPVWLRYPKQRMVDDLSRLISPCKAEQKIV